jgi:hypothetical protein
MKAFMVVVSCVALIAAIFAFLKYGWFSGLGLLISSSVAFALSQLYDLVGDLFATIHSQDKSSNPGSTKQAQLET